jgi:hypothetical protein
VQLVRSSFAPFPKAPRLGIVLTLNTSQVSFGLRPVPTLINVRTSTAFRWRWVVTLIRLTILASEQIFQNAHDNLLLERLMVEGEAGAAVG